MQSNASRKHSNDQLLRIETEDLGLGLVIVLYKLSDNNTNKTNSK